MEKSRITIHCAGTPNGVSRWTIEDIDKWHHERGFYSSTSLEYKHVGYHGVIHTSGWVVQGRRYEDDGAHTLGHNETSIGVCMIGTDKFTDDQWSALRRYCVDRQLIVERPLVVSGHRDMQSGRECPGFSVEGWILNGCNPMPVHVCEEVKS